MVNTKKWRLMRVISGKYKGRKILVESKSDYRPTLTRIREDIFNLLLHNNDLNINLNEVILCDLFAGTGSIGICLLYTSPSPRDAIPSRMPSSA